MGKGVGRVNPWEYTYICFESCSIAVVWRVSTRYRVPLLQDGEEGVVEWGGE